MIISAFKNSLIAKPKPKLGLGGFIFTLKNNKINKLGQSCAKLRSSWASSVFLSKVLRLSSLCPKIKFIFHLNKNLHNLLVIKKLRSSSIYLIIKVIFQLRVSKIYKKKLRSSSIYKRIEVFFHHLFQAF